MKKVLKQILPFAVDLLLIGVMVVSFYIAFYKISTASESENIIVDTTNTQIEAESFGEVNILNSGVIDLPPIRSYLGENLSITLYKGRRGGTNSLMTYYIADVYVKDVKCIGTVLAENTFGKGISEHITKMDAGSIMALNGDNYGAASKGPIVRNGIVYRSERSEADVGILYTNGEFNSYSPNEFDMETAIANGAYHVWTFGPTLVKDGKACTEFNTTRYITNFHPRTAIGYYEPGHYCFVVVDGRDSKNSFGMTIQQLAKLFENIGCKRAYNLDGGASAILTFKEEVINQPDNGGRETSDCIILKEVE